MQFIRPKFQHIHQLSSKCVPYVSRRIKSCSYKSNTQPFGWNPHFFQCLSASLESDWNLPFRLFVSLLSNIDLTTNLFFLLSDGSFWLNPVKYFSYLLVSNTFSFSIWIFLLFDFCPFHLRDISRQSGQQTDRYSYTQKHTDIQRDRHTHTHTDREINSWVASTLDDGRQLFMYIKSIQANWIWWLWNESCRPAQYNR